MNIDKKGLIEIIQSSDKEELEFSSKTLTGLSNKSLTSLLQKLAKKMGETEVYVEVGVFQGLSLLSVAKVVPDKVCYGVDNFSQFDPEGINLSMVKSRAKEIGCKNYEVINKDFELALKSLSNSINGKEVGLYFVDGPHDYRSQLLCLEMIKPFLSSNAIIIIDDCNYLHVRQATADFCQLNPEFKVCFQTYSDGHPHNFKVDERDRWWNGVNLIIKDEENRFEGVQVPTDPERRIFFSDHLFMSGKMPEQIAEMNLMVSSLVKLDIIKFLRSTWKIWRKRNLQSNGRFGGRNTFSQNLKYDRITK
jgi:predicted O-methyltransferase YrrM